VISECAMDVLRTTSLFGGFSEERFEVVSGDLPADCACPSVVREMRSPSIALSPGGRVK
jgi:hypothetical protein